MSHPVDEHTLGIREAAERAGVHPNTIRKWIVDGKLPAIKRGPYTRSALRIRPEDLDALQRRV